MLKEKLKIIVLLAVFAVIITGSVIAYNLLGSRLDIPHIITDNTDEQNQAPDFSMIDINGNTVRLSGMKGKPIVLNFWASWCPPCRIEMPDFDKVYKELGDVVQFMMVNLVDGVRETASRGEAYIGENSFSFPVYFDTRQEGAYAYRIRSIPTTLFIDSDGFIAAAAQGAINEVTLRKGIELILSNNP
jgi:thiol-disulfide isomerase/thioredoxin